MSRQQDLFTDLPRGEQLAALRRLKLKSTKHRGRAISGAICKSVLRAIDDHDGGNGCFASQQTIADEVGCSVATVSRAIGVLASIDLITVERPNPWSPNNHRVNWTAVNVLANCHDDDGTMPKPILQNAKSEMAQCQDRDGTTPSSSWSNAIQNAPSIANLNAPTNRPEPWAVVVSELFRWGLKSAPAAVDAARERGWSIEYVRALWLESGGDRDPERWEPGQLANWLTGRTDPPFDVFEVLRRDRERLAADQHEAERIRESIRIQSIDANVAPVVAAGITFRKLATAGLHRFATSEEREAAVVLDDIDAKRQERQPPANRPPDAYARDVGRVPTTSEPDNTAKRSQGLTGVRRVPRTFRQSRDKLHSAITGAAK